jgi:hypothetical protein
MNDIFGSRIASAVDSISSVFESSFFHKVPQFFLNEEHNSKSSFSIGVSVSFISFFIKNNFFFNLLLLKLH